jgi:putative sulfotransferase
MFAPTFVVGTGRCGSTLLSGMLREHPHVASLSEVFSFATDLGGRIAESFPDAPIDGPAFWRIVASAHPKISLLLRHDLVMDEVLWRPGGRFAAAEVPALLHTALPHLSDAPETLFDALAAEVATWGTAQVATHYRALFDRLAAGRAGWVERSGGSLRIVARLARAFPDARFVHLVRDGRDCAVSMSRHYGFRMALVAAQLTEILGSDPFESDDRTWEADVPDALAAFLPERFDADAFRRYETAIPLCGHYWAGEVVAGVADLVPLEDRVLVLRYEDLLTDPRATLGRLSRFLAAGPVDETWLDRAAAQVRAPRSRWTELPGRTVRELEDACRPGFDALGDLYASERAA